MKVKAKKSLDEWLERAESDLLYAQAGEKETQRHHITCFLCHQAVEKILKGLISGMREIPQKTHSLRLLLAKVKELYPTLEWEERDVQQLDACYIPSRYPGPIEKEFSSKDSTSALEITERMLNKARTV